MYQPNFFSIVQFSSAPNFFPKNQLGFWLRKQNALKVWLRSENRFLSIPSSTLLAKIFIDNIKNINVYKSHKKLFIDRFKFIIEIDNSSTFR